MKKIFLIFLSIIISLSVVSCGENEGENSYLEQSASLNEVVSENTSKDYNSQDSAQPSEEDSLQSSEASDDYLKLAEDFSWEFKDGVLILSGHGATPDYEDIKDVPWNDMRLDVKELNWEKMLI